MAKGDRNLSKGWHYLLTRRVALRILETIALKSVDVTCGGHSYSERSEWTWLPPRRTKRYCFGSALLIRCGGERELHLELVGLKEETIGDERSKILDICTKKLIKWLQGHPPLLETAPKQEARFSFEFERVLEDGTLVLEDA